MEKPSAAATLDKECLLRAHNITEDDFTKTGLEWPLLQRVCDRHIAMEAELRTTADYISQRLQSVHAVHSLKIRIKHPEHLIAKLVRKKLEHADLTFDDVSYPSRITDLIGIRALHLFKHEWLPIHEFVTSAWELHEQPIAYVRDGDPETVIEDLTKAQFNVQRHPFGYRSIHYVIKSSPGKTVHLAELQVRTLFEEGWSEIDHRVRYPRQSDDPYLAQFLTIFNRLAGSADEMGTFVKSLSTYGLDQTARIAQREQELTKKEGELKQAVSRLKISEADKAKLEKQIAGLLKSNMPGPAPYRDVSLRALAGAGVLSNPYVADLSVGGRTCNSCGKPLPSTHPTYLMSNLCQDCSTRGTRFRIEPE